MHYPLTIDPQIQAALAENKPVVALESTVITHGLPYPHNVETAVGMEAAVRNGGALPATIGIIGGEIIVGLSAGQIEYLGRQAGTHTVRKCSRRDLPLVVARREDGATTVAGTIIIAHLAGIELFATGGIGGVHRGHPFDVSADLIELGRTPVTVVCSGAKSILDLPATREVLETQGVAVVGFQTDEVPSFFTRHSGLTVDICLESAEDVAAVIRARQTLDLQSGMLVTIPVPPSAALDDEEMEMLIAQATGEADRLGIHGAATTPWLLDRIRELTDGRSLQANVALLHNNAMVAAQIAAALAKMTESGF